MAKTKPSEAKTTLNSWEEVDGLLKEIALKKISVTELESDMNCRLINIQDTFQPKLNDLNSVILGHEKNIELFCTDNKEEFKNKKSKELNYGVVTFRTGTPKLATLKGFTWDAVKAVITNSKKYFAMFIRVKHDLDKSAMLSSGLSEGELAKLGVHITQDESFSYEAYLKESKGVA